MNYEEFILNRRTKEINKAIQKAKLRDHNKCRICYKTNKMVIIDGAHLLPRNNPSPKNDPTNAENIIALCRNCHIEYDKNKTIEKRIDWFRERGKYNLAEKLYFLGSENIWSRHEIEFKYYE